VVDEGVTGMVVHSVEEAVAALPGVMLLDRRQVRRQFERRFTAARMAKDYLEVYRSLLSRSELDVEPAGSLQPAAAIGEPDDSRVLIG
jgi:hypothetical protein